GQLQFSDDTDHLAMVAEMLGLATDEVVRLIDEVHAFPHAHIRNVRFVQEDGVHILYADVDGTVPDLPLGALSGREAERVIIEFATAAARVSGRYGPTLLILDGCPALFFDGIFSYYSHHLLDPENQFQTIMCIPSRDLDLDAVRWCGWEVIRMVG